MVEIYSYDITTHERYAHDQKEIESFRKQYHIPPSGEGVIADKARVLDFVPKHPAIVLLMQTHQRKMWARFSIPDHFYEQRFSSSYIAPSIGPTEKQGADMDRIDALLRTRQGAGASQEGKALKDLLGKGVKETNEMVAYVKGRILQFVQA
ncbi:MAG: hypothetical protein K940chlam9_00114 [Chlamydiae bacterium]|nr:hypothetical protein [Chlamydiota bacterium]